jgi:hypothetical protein
MTARRDLEGVGNQASFSAASFLPYGTFMIKDMVSALMAR